MVYIHQAVQVSLKRNPIYRWPVPKLLVLPSKAAEGLLCNQTLKPNIVSSPHFSNRGQQPPPREGLVEDENKDSDTSSVETWSSCNHGQPSPEQQSMNTYLCNHPGRVELDIEQRAAITSFTDDFVELEAITLATVGLPLKDGSADEVLTIQ